MAVDYTFSPSPNVMLTS